MRLIVAGSRWIPEGVALLIVDAAIRVHQLLPSELISGMAPGPDKAGATWARARGVRVRAFWAQWAELGDAAGPERNERMARAGSHLIAIWDGYSSGTADMIERARARRLWLRVLEVVPSPATAARLDAERRAQHRRPLPALRAVLTREPERPRRERAA